MSNKSKYDASSFLTSSTFSASLEAELEEAQQQVQLLQEENQKLSEALNKIGSTSGTKTEIPIAKIRRSPDQSRFWFDPVEIEKLAKAIERFGFQGTVLVGTPDAEGMYPIIFGERRILAAERAGYETVPVDIRALERKDAATLTFIENSLRVNLNPYEETVGMLRLLAEHLGVPVDQVSLLLYQMKNAHEGKSEFPENTESIQTLIEEYLPSLSWLSFVTTRMKLLKLPEDVQEVLKRGKIEYTKAIAIAKVSDSVKRQTILEVSLTENLSLSEIKERIRVIQGSKPSKSTYKRTLGTLQGLDPAGFSREQLAELEVALKEKLQAISSALKQRKK
ncbi:MAG TPA: ParB/RepB/Spo0J family partition protein [Allocoleopsis sp.]